MAETGRPYYKNGDYPLNDIQLHKDFETEKELCDYIEAHIQEFTTDCLGYEYKSHRREYPVSEGKRYKGNRRIDFLIVTKDNLRIGVECKHPRYTCEVTSGIGQCLNYLTMFELHGNSLNKMAMVTTKMDPIAPFTLDKFNLPIILIGFDKDKFITFKHGSSNRK